MPQSGQAAFDLNAPDRSIFSCAGASDVLRPDEHAADASYPPFINLVDVGGGVGLYGYENPSLEELIAGPEKEVHKEQAMDPRDDDGLVSSNAEDQLPQSGDKTLPIIIFPEDEAPGFPEPPPVPESFPRDPVPQGGKGEGWPYAPQGWPRPEDKWGWRVGQRAGANFLWIDRYVILPVSLMKGKKVNISDEQFASKKSLVEYVKRTFPQVKDPNSIVKAFDWKVPAPKNLETRGLSGKRDKTSPTNGDDDCWQRSKKQCRARNPHCPLTKGKFNESESLERLFCHICCTEPDFCRECKCILCCKPFAPGADDFSVVRCLNTPLSGSNSRAVCGHAAHLECALNSQLAGVIKRNKLHLEYVCRRCDRKTSLKETLSRLVMAFLTADAAKVQSSLQLLLRVVHDPGDGADGSEKIHDISVRAFQKVQDGADIVTSCKELTEQLLEYLQSERSLARTRKRTLEDHSPRSHEAEPVDSPDVAAFRVQVNHTLNIHRSSSSVIELNRFIVAEVCEGNARVEPGLKKPSLRPENLLMPSPLSWSLPRLLDESVSKPPTLSIEEHIRQCEAMIDRVKGAGTFGNADPKPPSFLAIEYQVASPTPSRDAEKDRSPDAGAKLMEKSRLSSADSEIYMEVKPLQMREVPPSQGVSSQPELEGKIREALKSLQRAQAAEYAHVEEALQAQKKFVVEQYLQLDKFLRRYGKKPKPKKVKLRGEYDRDIHRLTAQYTKAQEGLKVFESMLAISNGFGQLPEDFLREFFNWSPSVTP